jgi:glutamate-1-semialdehyde 2,1-aminomutase
MTAYQLFEEQYIAKTKASRKMYEEARQHLPGGVAGSGAYRKPYPLYMKKAQGSRLWDVDGNEYIDIMCSAGPAILGHSPAPVIMAVREQLEHGTVTLVTSEAAIEVAKRIKQHMPGMEMVRFVNSGSEAVHLALRVARAYTGREKHAKFEGNYHGQMDNELVSGDIFGGPENSPEPIAQGAGIPRGVLNDVVVLPWNNSEASVAIIKKHAKELAAVLLEPMAGMYLGGIPAEKSFVEALRKVCDEEGIVLIFDEVVTGFRLGLSGAYSITGVTPDLRILGKLIGGGFPVGAYGGRKDIMEKVVSPVEKPAEARSMQYEGPKIFQSGTFSGNPISMTAGLAMIKELEKPGFYERIDGYGERVRSGLRKIVVDLGIPVQVVGVGSMFCLHFSEHSVMSIRDFSMIDKETGAAFYMGWEANGIHCPPFHLGFTSGAHTGDDIDKVLEVAEMVLQEIKAHQDHRFVRA